MKFKTTDKFLRESGRKIFKIPYCRLQYLLQYKAPIAYNCDIFGWRYDVYDLNSFVITTGYQPIGNTLDYALIKRYDNKARDLSRKEDIDLLLEMFIEEVQEKKEKTKK